MPMPDAHDLRILKDLSRRHHDLLTRCVSGISPGTSGLTCAARLTQMTEELSDSTSLIRLDINRNRTICHALPDDTAFSEGDIITLDLVLERKGLFADGSWSLICGDDIYGMNELLDMAWASARQAVISVVPGGTSLQMKKDLHELLRSSSLALLGEACGHGIGRQLHMPPDIHYLLQDEDDILWRNDMIFTAEPVITAGETSMVQDRSGNWITENEKACAYFEHMCLIEEGKVSCLNIPEIKGMNCIDIF